MNGSRSWNNFFKEILFFRFFFSSQERHGSICFRRGKLRCALILLYLAEWVTSLPFYRDVVLTENLRNQTNLLTEVGRNRPKTDETDRNWTKLTETDRNRRNWSKLDETIRKQTEAFVIRRVYWLVSFMNIAVKCILQKKMIYLASSLAFFCIFLRL